MATNNYGGGASGMPPNVRLFVLFSVTFLTVLYSESRKL